MALLLAACSGPAATPAATPTDGATPTSSAAPSGTFPIEDTGQTLTFGLVMIDLTNQFFVDMMEGGELAADDYNVNLVWKSADGSVDNQISLMENFIQQKVDVILVNPIESAALQGTIEKASAAGIPTITMAGEVDLPTNFTTVYNDEHNNRLIGEILAQAVGNEGKVALLYGNKGNLVSDLRQKGFQDAIANHPNIELIEQPMNWDPPTGLKVMQDILAANPDLKAVHSVSDAVTSAAYEAIRAAGKENDIIVTSHDGNPEGNDAVADGRYLANVLTGAKKTGYWNVKVGVELMFKPWPTERVLNLPTHIVMLPEQAEKFADILASESVVTPVEANAIGDTYRDELYDPSLRA
ncbi:MAG: sugar ABC transporter substrate-binding protein [Actinobacteria bacterium]|nr:sugar ABC transporter substrate-binding protein [Actinomycetota bacterium]